MFGGRGVVSEIQSVVAGLSEQAKRDIRDGNCIMNGGTCVCCSDPGVKGELAHHRLADFSADLDAGCLLNRNGLAVRAALQERDQ
jgi:hypothetical protein